jgi:hypothetical protein
MRATMPAVMPRRSPRVHFARIDRFCMRVVRVLDTANRTASRGTIRITLDCMPTRCLPAAPCLVRNAACRHSAKSVESNGREPNSQW